MLRSLVGSEMCIRDSSIERSIRKHTIHLICKLRNQRFVRSFSFIFLLVCVFRCFPRGNVPVRAAWSHYIKDKSPKDFIIRVVVIMFVSRLLTIDLINLNAEFNISFCSKFCNLSTTVFEDFVCGIRYKRTNLSGIGG